MSASAPVSTAPVLDISRETGLTLCQSIKCAMAAAGMGRPESGMSGAEVTGLIAPDHYGSTGFSVALRSGQQAWDRLQEPHLHFHVVLDGRGAGLHFRDFTEYSETAGVMAMHEPTDQATLHETIRQLFTALGFEVRSVLDGGYQGHWDYDVEYDVLCSVPKCLPSISPPSV